MVGIVQTVNNMNFKKISHYIIVIIFILIISFLLINKNNNSVNNFDIKNTKYVKIGGEIIKVDLALTSTDQENGLSFRENLKNDEGMLFIFDNVGTYPFWMKDMSFPIDIIWIGEDFRVIFIKENATPESFPEIFSPNKNSKYVLEVNALFSQKKNLKEGDKVEFLP